MKLINEIINILDILYPNEGVINVEGKEFIRVNNKGIFLNKKYNLLEKIILPFHKNEEKMLNYKTFFKEISGQIISLDHVGIRYSCSNIEKEIKSYKNIINNTSLELVEEENPEGSPRWFFIKNKEDEKMPMFEIALSESKEKALDEWTPHFQFDVNTSLSIEELKEKTNDMLEPNFIKWKLTIPRIGVVLVMGFLGQINGTKICIGLGTKSRSVSERNESLKKV